MRKSASVFLVVALVVVGLPAGAFAGPTVRDKQVQAQTLTGTVTGTAKNATGEKLAGSTIRIRNSRTGAIAAEAVTDSAGGFTVSDVPAGNYIIEVVSDKGSILGLSPAFGLPAGTTVTIPLTATTEAAIAAAGATGGGVGLFGLGAAATIGIVGAAATVAVVGVKVKKDKKDKKDASPSK